MIDVAEIREHMEVVANGGEHVGTVDHLEAQKRIRLTRSDRSADGQHHWIPLEEVESVDDKVHLRCSADEARRIQAREA